MTLSLSDTTILLLRDKTQEKRVSLNSSRIRRVVLRLLWSTNSYVSGVNCHGGIYEAA